MKNKECTLTNDLRSWLTKVADFGQLEQISGVHWDLELATLVEILNEEKNVRPAVIFDRIADYPQGYRVAVNLLSSVNRMALTVGMDPNTSAFEFIQAWRHKVKTIKPVDPLIIPDGPLFERTFHGSQIDMLSFPVPRWHELDGGRYIGTDDLVITQDPDEGWINVGTYRIMVHGKDQLALYISPGKHGRVHRDKYIEQGKPFPVAVSFGHHPLNLLVASNDIPYGINEYAYAGGIIEQPLQLVKGPLTGLPLPADSEIAIEGEVLPGDVKPEGPFGEWTGYYASSRRAEPVIQVKAVYHRRDPILCGFPLLRPTTGDTIHHSLMRAAHIWNSLDEAGIPDIKGVWVPPAAGRFLTVVAIRQRYPGHAKQTATIASQCRAGAYLGRYVIVVEDDIDITNFDDVLWALCSRSDPVRSIDILRRCWSGPLDPAISQEEKGLNSRALIDATRPYEWKDQFPLVSGASRELKDSVKKKWRELLKRENTR